MFRKKFRGVVFFDIDDTLVFKSKFFEKAIEKSLNEVIFQGFNKDSLENLKREYLEIYDKDKNARNHYFVLFSKYFQDFKEIKKYEQIAVEKRHELKKKIYFKFKVENLNSVLKYLIKQGFILGIISDGLKEKQEEKLNLLKIKNYFNEENIWITDKQKFEKETKFYSSIYKMYSKKYLIEDFWMIGDREDKDILPIKEYNFKTIRVDWGIYNVDIVNSKANFIITNFIQIKDVIK